MGDAMEPAKQGEFDGACGLYSIGNALSFMFPDRGKDAVFYEVFRQYHQLYGDSQPLVHGLYRSRLNEILKASVAELGLPCTIYRPYWAPTVKPSLSGFKETLIGGVGAGLCIIGYDYCRNDEDDYYSHWTVITRVTDRSMKTLDSSSEPDWIPFSKCRMWDERGRHRSRPYKLSHTDTFLLSTASDVASVEGAA